MEVKEVKKKEDGKLSAEVKRKDGDELSAEVKKKEKKEDDDDELDDLEDPKATDRSDENQIHSVIDGLYLTGIAGASELWKLKRLHIAHVVNASDKANCFPDRRDFSYTRVDVLDLPSEAANTRHVL